MRLEIIDNPPRFYRYRDRFSDPSRLVNKTGLPAMLLRRLVELAGKPELFAAAVKNPDRVGTKPGQGYPGGVQLRPGNSVETGFIDKNLVPLVGFI